jgi:hypothetical protein
MCLLRPYFLLQFNLLRLLLGVAWPWHLLLSETRSGWRETQRLLGIA